MRLFITIFLLAISLPLFSQVVLGESCDVSCEVVLVEKFKDCLDGVPYWTYYYSDDSVVHVEDTESDNWCDCEEVVDCDEFFVEIVGRCRNRIIINPFNN